MNLSPVTRIQARHTHQGRPEAFRRLVCCILQLEIRRIYKVMSVYEDIYEVLVSDNNRAFEL